MGPTTLGPVQGSSTPTGSPLGGDLPDQDQASDTNELCSPLYTFGTILRDCLQFVSMLHNHIFLCQMYRNVIRAIFSPYQFNYFPPSSIWDITTPRFYFLGTTFIIKLQIWHLDTIVQKQYLLPSKVFITI